MADLSFKNIQKIYDNGVQAVFDFNLEVKDKEFIVLVGPSGCGKSTTLRMLAGLEEISDGEISIDGKVINNVAPKDRDIAMVFQNYALYPHMTVYNNMAFALKLRKIPFKVLDENGNEIIVVDDEKIKKLEEEKELLLNPDIVYAPGYDKEKVDARIVEIDKLVNEENLHPTKIKTILRHYTKQEIDEKITEVSNILGLNPYLKRKPAALSGGQRQRVALGRAIVRNPKVFLMDEPLSNLDAKLRVQMRSEITKIHKRVNATTIYVTHDQTEAMTMASRIVIMKDGYIQQIGTPKDVYNNPTNMFVAGFIGSPAMNFIKGKFDGKHFITEDGEVNIALKSEQCKSLSNYINKSVVLGIRPEDIYLKDDPSKENPSSLVEIKCDISELLGHELIVYGKVSNQKIIIKTKSKFNVDSDDSLKYVFDMDKILFFDAGNNARIYLDGSLGYYLLSKDPDQEKE